LVDAQLPARLAAFLGAAGHDVVHTSQLPAGNRTTDAAIAGPLLELFAANLDAIVGAFDDVDLVEIGPRARAARSTRSELISGHGLGHELRSRGAGHAETSVRNRGRRS
jgi:hypothetical protein